MAKNDNKSKAEVYREERKARIAKANKRNAKSLDVGKKVGKAAKRVIAVVLAAAIVVGVGYLVVDGTGVDKRFTTALKVGNEKVSSTEYYYYYYMAYQQAAYTQQNTYDPMNYTYFDTSKSPDEQDYPVANKDGTKKTWAQAFVETAQTNAQWIIANYSEATKAGYTLTDDEITSIEETVSSYAENAAKNGYSLNAYLRSSFGVGFNEKTFREQIEKEIIAQRFHSDKETEYKEGITEDAIKAEFDTDPSAYGYVDVRYYAFTYETLTKGADESDDAFAKRQETANAATVEAAEAVQAGIKDEATFKSQTAAYAASLEADKEEAKEGEEAAKPEEKEETDDTLHEAVSFSTLSSSIEKDGAKWALDSARKAGDLTLIKGEKGAYLVYMVAPQYFTNSVSVRYCLISYNEEHTKAADEDERTAAKDEAEALYKTWKDAGDLSEEAFGKICTQNSDDTSTSDEGGLIDVRVNQMVSSFEDWCFDAARKPGDTGVVEAEEYGYFLIYFVSNNKDDLDWKNTVRTRLGSTALDDYDKALLAEDGSYALVNNSGRQEAVMNDFCDTMKRNIALSSGSQAR